MSWIRNKTGGIGLTDFWTFGLFKDEKLRYGFRGWGGVRLCSSALIKVQTHTGCDAVGRVKGVILALRPQGSGSRDSEELTQLNPPWWISWQRHATIAQKCEDNLYLIFSSPPRQGVTQPTSQACLQACGGGWTSLAPLSTKHQTLISAIRTSGRIWIRENRQNPHTRSYVDRIFDPEWFFIHNFVAWTWRITLSSNQKRLKFQLKLAILEESLPFYTSK